MRRVNRRAKNRWGGRQDRDGWQWGMGYDYGSEDAERSNVRQPAQPTIVTKNTNWKGTGDIESIAKVSHIPVLTRCSPARGTDTTACSPA